MTSNAITDDVIRLLFSSKQLRDLSEDESAWRLGTFGILKRAQPTYNIGWSFPLFPESRLYVRWFELSDREVRGWAIVFRIFDPVGEPLRKYEQFVGWVPPERKDDAARWVDFLNAQIQDRLRNADARSEATASTGKDGPFDARSNERPRVPVKRVGCFRELGYDDDAPSLEASRGLRSSAELEKVVSYLRAGKVAILSPGLARDVFDRSVVAGSRSMLTDGEYLWPEVLAHYVDRYGVALPQDFESHMARRHWQPPESVDIEDLQLQDQE